MYGKLNNVCFGQISFRVEATFQNTIFMVSSSMSERRNSWCIVCYSSFSIPTFLTLWIHIRRFESWRSSQHEAFLWKLRTAANRGCTLHMFLVQCFFFARLYAKPKLRNTIFHTGKIVKVEAKILQNLRRNKRIVVL